MSDTPEYTVGHGKPPLHTRFKKGQSGNPSGRPGPAKLAKLRLRRFLHRALGEEKLRVRFSQPKTSLESIANYLVADAACGNVTSMRLLLSLLDAEIEESRTSGADADETDCEQADAETDPANNLS